MEQKFWQAFEGLQGRFYPFFYRLIVFISALFFPFHQGGRSADEVRTIREIQLAKFFSIEGVDEGSCCFEIWRIEVSRKGFSGSISEGNGFAIPGINIVLNLLICFK